VLVFSWFLRLLPDFPEHEAHVVFHSLLLPDVDRRIVSNTFQRLLGNQFQLCLHCVVVVVTSLTVEETLDSGILWEILKNTT